MPAPNEPESDPGQPYIDAEPAEPAEPADSRERAPSAAGGGRGRGCATGCGFAAVGLMSAVVGGLVMSLLLPALLGVDPVAMLRGAYLRPDASTTTAGPVRIVSTQSTEPPTVAVAEKLTPSVVNISTEALRFDFFGGTRAVRGNGSGVIMTSDGYILTNDHVVEGTDRIYVSIGGDANVEGTVKGRDPESDLAVIKVDRKGLTPAEFGDSDRLKVGQAVVAVGSPFGLEHSVTSGIISALHRNEDSMRRGGQVTYTDLIQTDAAINPGNSGGALADMKGRVIGINTLISAPSVDLGAPQNAGVGFAIPARFAEKVAQQLIKNGEAEHPYIGIRSTLLTEELAEQQGTPAKHGALIVGVEPGQPAAAAGVKSGDVLVEISGRQIKEIADIFAAVRDHRVGDTVTLVVYRGQRKMSIKVKLAERPKLESSRG